MKSRVLWIGAVPPENDGAIQAALAGAGLSLRPVSDPDEALPLLAEAGAAVVDLSDPRLNGVRLCGQARAADESLRLVGLYQGEPYLRQAALAAGVDVVTLSPPDAEVLLGWLTAETLPESQSFKAIVGGEADDALNTAAILSHDLKTPISIIISTLEVLSAYQPEEDASSVTSNTRLLRGALHAAYRQMYLVMDMIDLMRLELHGYELECSPCNLGGLLRDFMDSEAGMQVVKKLKFTLEMSDAPLVAEVDDRLVWRMFTALMDNVTKFTIHDDILAVRAWVQDKTVAISFTDSGRPIFPGFERRVVERAPRWKDREAGTRTSVAMGLPFVYAAAKAQGGHLAAATDPATRLTTFTLTFPAV